MHRHPRTAPAVFQVTVTGPFDPRPGGDTPSRRRIFGPAGNGPEASPAAEARARTILARLARTAYRQPVTDDDLRRPLQFFREASAGEGGFEPGAERCGVLAPRDQQPLIGPQPEQGQRRAIAAGAARRIRIGDAERCGCGGERCGDALQHEPRRRRDPLQPCGLHGGVRH
jgi:hypothetical protein